MWFTRGQHAMRPADILDCFITGCAAAPPCVNDDWACQWAVANFDPLYRMDTPRPFLPKFVVPVVDYFGRMNSHTKFSTAVSVKFRGIGWNTTKFCYLYSLDGNTSDPSTDFCAWWLKRREFTKDVPFRGFVNIRPHLWDQYQRDFPLFWGVNRHFKPNSKVLRVNDP